LIITTFFACVDDGGGRALALRRVLDAQVIAVEGGGDGSARAALG
jgi:hypothetical protein